MNYILHIIVMIDITVPVVLGLNLVLGRGKILHFGSIGVSVFIAYAVFQDWGNQPDHYRDGPGRKLLDAIDKAIDRPKGKKK